MKLALITTLTTLVTTAVGSGAAAPQESITLADSEGCSVQLHVDPGLTVPPEMFTSALERLEKKYCPGKHDFYLRGHDGVADLVEDNQGMVVDRVDSTQEVTFEASYEEKLGMEPQRKTVKEVFKEHGVTFLKEGEEFSLNIKSQTPHENGITQVVYAIEDMPFITCFEEKPWDWTNCYATHTMHVKLNGMPEGFSMEEII